MKVRILSYLTPSTRKRRPRTWISFAALGAGIYAFASFGLMMTLWNGTYSGGPKNNGYETVMVFFGNSAPLVAAFALAASSIVWLRRPSGSVEIIAFIIAAAFWGWFFAMEFPHR